MMAIILERIGFNNIRVRMGIFHRSLVNGHPFFTKKFKDFSGLSETPFRAKKSLDSMSFLVLPQHEQFHPEGLSVLAPFMQLRIWVG